MSKELIGSHSVHETLMRQTQIDAARIKELERERDALQADNARLREALEYCVTQVGELATVPGIASALSSTPEQSLARVRNQVREFDGEALLALYRSLRHPVQAGPMWVRYRRQGVDGALDVVESLMKKHGFEFKPANEPEAQ